MKNKNKSLTVSKPQGNNLKEKSNFFIVGIGASAGGLEAFEIFFQNMPADSGMAFILVPHLDPKHVSLMPDIIQKNTAMKVNQIKDGMKVIPNTVFIVPPNKDLAILNGTLQLLNLTGIAAPKMRIDYFFRSLAHDQKRNAIGIVLSGMGTDGTLGLRAIKGELGMTMAQTVDSAAYESMPRSAIETGLVDYILSPEKMPLQLISFASHTILNVRADNPVLNEKTIDDFQKIFILLRAQTGHDFSFYKKNTINRRIERRMNVNQIQKISNYVRYLQKNTSEVEILFKELLIGVTNFFRDNEAFESLKQNALIPLLKKRKDDNIFRVWIPGCSTGEEAYSLAILLRECIDTLKSNIGVQIFATDLDENAIENARSGIFPSSISVDVNAERLKRFFKLDDHMYIINKSIREMIIFASQDIIKDPPFTKLDLVSCRNLLIYLESKLQKRIMPLFHYSLRQNGILFLGNSETISNFTDLFSPVDRKWKIFSREESIPAHHMMFQFPTLYHTDKILTKEKKMPKTTDVALLAQKKLLTHYAPASVIINEKGDILYIHGRTGKYLEPAPGDARLNVFEMAREGLKFELPALIRNVIIQKKVLIKPEVEIKENGNSYYVNLTIMPLLENEKNSGLIMVVFEDMPVTAKKEDHKIKSVPGKKQNDRLAALEKELNYTKNNLQDLIEKMEISNEELKSANEELQSTNEELQSTNEELETTKEEQQSMNEELTTVNSELQGKVEELGQTNDDLNNLLDAIEIPTFFLDNNLCIKRFTSHTNRIVNLIQTDIGRPLADIVSKIKGTNIVEVANEVLKDLVFRVKEVKTTDNLYFTMRVFPYRTTENVIDGVVITFTDSTKEKELEQREAQLNSKLRLATVIKDSNDAITLIDLEGKIHDWNHGAEKMYGYTKGEALKFKIFNLIPKEKHKETSHMLKEIEMGKEINSFRTKRQTKNSKILDVWLTITKLVDTKNNRILLATTERDLAWLNDQDA